MRKVNLPNDYFKTNTEKYLKKEVEIIFCTK